MSQRNQRTKQELPSEKVNIAVIGTNLKYVTRSELPPQQDGTHYRNVDALVAAQLLEGRAPSRFINSKDDTWDVMARALRQLHQNIKCYEDGDIGAPIFESTPPDLPVALARMRLDILEKHSRICDIPTMIELSEIELASVQKRPVDRELFSTESVQSSWIGKMSELPVNVVYHLMDAVNERAIQGNSEDPLAHAMNYLEFAELTYTRNHLIDQQLHQTPTEQAEEERIAMSPH